MRSNEPAKTPVNDYHRLPDSFISAMNMASSNSSGYTTIIASGPAGGAGLTEEHVMPRSLSPQQRQLKKSKMTMGDDENEDGERYKDDRRRPITFASLVLRTHAAAGFLYRNEA